MKSLQARSFVATALDIKRMTREFLRAGVACKSIRGMYLKALVATAQAERAALEPAPSRNSKFDTLEARLQMKAMLAVHKRFYEDVLAEARAECPKDAVDMNKRTNFARSAKYKLRRWMAAGNDIRVLVASTVTHADLKTTKHKGPWSADRFQRRTVAWAGHIVDATTAYAKEDRDTAVATLEAAIGRLAGLLAELGGKPTADIHVAIRDHRPYRDRAGGKVYWPATDSGGTGSDSTAERVA